MLHTRSHPLAPLLLAAALLASCASDPAPIDTPSPFASTTPASPGVRSADAFVASRATWTFESTPGQIIETPHYRILTTVRPGLLTDRLPGFVEGAIAAYTRALGPLPRPRERMDTYVMQNRPQWARLTQSLMRERAEIYLRIQRGGYAADGRGVYFDIGLQDTLAIAAHEGWHQYTQTTFADRLPVWLEEGIAAYMEGYRWDTLQNRAHFLGWANVERYDTLRKAREENKLIPLESLLTSEPATLLRSAATDPLVYYAQAWALVHWLREGDAGRYRPALEKLLADAASGRLRATVRDRLGDASMLDRRLLNISVFQAYFDRDLAGASARYRAFLEHITRPGSKDHVVAGLSPVAR